MLNGENDKMKETSYTTHQKCKYLTVTSGNQEVRYKFVDGKATNTIWTLPYDCTVIGAIAILNEAPDATATTYTVKLTDGTNDLTDTMTFTEGTDAAGVVKGFKMDTTYNGLSAGDTLKVVTAGTTTTAGETTVIVFLSKQG